MLPLISRDGSVNSFALPQRSMVEGESGFGRELPQTPKRVQDMLGITATAYSIVAILGLSLYCSATRMLLPSNWFVFILSSDIFAVSTRSIALTTICFTCDCVRKSSRFYERCSPSTRGYARFTTTALLSSDLL